MVIRSILALALALNASQIWAMPIANLGCNSSSYERGLNDLVQKTRLIGKDQNGKPIDNREAIVRTAKKENWPQEKLDQILKNSGEIFCPWMVDKKGREVGFSASIIGTELTLGTSQHLFYNLDPERKVKPIPKVHPSRFNECRFENYDRPASVAKLVFEENPNANYKSFQFGELEDPKMAFHHDWVFVRLSNPLRGATGFPVDNSEAVLANGQKYLNVSRVQDGMKLINNKSYPKMSAIGHYCNDSFYSATYGALAVDCSSTPGVSGGVLLSERKDSFVAAGIASGGFNVDPSRGFQDGDPFDIATNSLRAAAINKKVIKAIEDIARPFGPVQSASVSY